MQQLFDAVTALFFEPDLFEPCLAASTELLSVYAMKQSSQSVAQYMLRLFSDTRFLEKVQASQDGLSL